MTVELTAPAAAAATTSALMNYLGAFTSGTATALGKEAVEQLKRLVGWLRERLRGPAKEALADLRTEPSEQTAAAFRQQLEASLAAYPALLESLRALLAEVPAAVRYGDQTATASGGSEVYQAQGSNISIRRG